MSFRKTALRFGAAVGAAAVAVQASAAGTAFDTISASVDFTTVAAWVTTMGVAVVGIAMAFKAIDLSKRGVKKA